MGRLFNLDSPIMVLLGKMADLMFINIVTMIACIPVVTIGASLTAMHYVVLKMVRKEEGYLFKSFVKSFKENFKQATICWLIILLFAVILVIDIRIVNLPAGNIANWMKIALIVVGIIGSMIVVYVFPLLARFENTVRGTFKNALLMSIFSLPKTVMMIVLYCIPTVLMLLAFNTFPIVFLFGFSGPAYFCAVLYSGTFKKFEPEQVDTDTGDDWHIEMGGEEEKVSSGE